MNKINGLCALRGPHRCDCFNCFHFLIFSIFFEPIQLVQMMSYNANNTHSDIHPPSNSPLSPYPFPCLVPTLATCINCIAPHIRRRTTDHTVNTHKRYATHHINHRIILPRSTQALIDVTYPVRQPIINRHQRRCMNRFNRPAAVTFKRHHRLCHRLPMHPHWHQAMDRRNTLTTMPIARDFHREVSATHVVCSLLTWVSQSMNTDNSLIRVCKICKPETEMKICDRDRTHLCFPSLYRLKCVDANSAYQLYM